MTDKQEEAWRNDFGQQYTERNPHVCSDVNEMYEDNFGISREDLNKQFLDGLNRNIKILEVGANVGAQLDCLQKMGFSTLYGIDIQPYAVKQAHQTNPSLNIVEGNASDIPYKNNFFDLVFTSGVLIHIPPSKLREVMSEIARCTKKYIWGFEYYAPTHTEIKYRGNDELLWKGDFVERYSQVVDVNVVQRSKINYIESDNVNEMFLLELTN